MKLIAILLVLNSHADSLYPGKLKILSTGGALGNTIFFIISGYLTNFLHGNFFKNLIYRFLRLYIPVYIFLLFVGGLLQIHNLNSALETLLWPTSYWFVSALFASFILLYMLERFNFFDKKGFYIVSIVFIFSYFLCYAMIGDEKILGVRVPFIRYIYCFYMYYIGYYMKVNNTTFNIKCSGSWVFVSFILIYASYFGDFILKSQLCHVINHFALIIFAVAILVFSLENENAYCKLNQRFIKCINKLSGVSLETYIVQFSLISFLAKKSNIIFPINLIILLILVFLSAYVLHFISNFLVNLIYKKQGSTTRKFLTP